MTDNNDKSSDLQIVRATQPTSISFKTILEAAVAIHLSGLTDSFIASCGSITQVFDETAINSIKEFMERNKMHVGSSDSSATARDMIYSQSGRCP